MNLTGKSKENFQDWFNSHEYFGYNHDLKLFKNDHDSMKWGVYVDWFQSTDKKAQVYIAPFFNHDLGTMYEWGAWAYGEFIMSYPTPNEARKEAIKQANLIYNQR